MQKLPIAIASLQFATSAAAAQSHYAASKPELLSLDQETRISQLIVKQAVPLSSGSFSIALDAQVPTSLDQPTRRRLVREFAELLRGRGMATVFVSHDFAEAAALCSRCAILDAGAIVQDEPPARVLERPRTSRVAEIVGIQ